MLSFDNDKNCLTKNPIIKKLIFKWIRKDPLMSASSRSIPFQVLISLGRPLWTFGNIQIGATKKFSSSEKEISHH